MDAHKNTEKRFGLFLKEHRTEHAITLEQLSDGLCSASELARIEAGTRIAGKALRDSLLYRLGKTYRRMPMNISSLPKITRAGKGDSSCFT